MLSRKRQTNQAVHYPSLTLRLKSIGRIKILRKSWGAWPHFLILAILLSGSGCDSKSQSDTPPVTQPPTLVAEIPPSRPIPDDALPLAEDELNVVGAFPGPGDTRVALVSPISVTFDQNLLAGQDLDQTIRVTNNGNQIAGNVSVQDTDTLVFRPTEMWQPNTQYSIEINPELMAEDGLIVNPELRWQFLTIADVHTTSQNIIDLCMSDLDVEMLAAVNQTRSESRLCGGNSYPATGKLTWNCQLQAAAIQHTQDMANNDFFDHTGSDGSRVQHRIFDTGYAALMAGENLAAGYPTVTEAITALLASTGHCITLMTPEFTEFGAAYAFNAQTDHWHYWTQNFALPATQR